jgi:hypothetical protein
MTVQAKPGFSRLVKLLDAINPVLILAATIGIFLDYSPLKARFVLANDVVAGLFAVDFVLRLIAFPVKPYLTRGWGWIDLLASLPGFLLLLQRTPLVALLRIVRVGRFFRIIRVLRFLRAFSFLKTMKDDSPWVQDRIMKIGVSVVFTSMLGIVALDYGARSGLEAMTARPYREAWIASGSSLASVEAMPGVVAVIESGTVRQITGSGFGLTATPAGWATARDDQFSGVLQIDLSPGQGVTVGSAVVPITGILVDARAIGTIHDAAVIISIATLLGVLLVIMFVVGAVFARDVRTLQLVVDSFDAGDYLLLREEVKRQGFSGENAAVDPGDDEMDNLLKVSAAAADLLETPASTGTLDAGLLAGTWPGAETASASLSEADLNRLADRLETRLASRLEQRDQATARDAIKAVAPAIVHYIKKLHA